MRERDVQKQLVDTLLAIGWKLYRPPAPSDVRSRAQMKRVGASGWPDVIAIKGSSMLALEVKGTGGRTSEQQIEWLQALGQVRSCIATVIDPENIDSICTLIEQGYADEIEGSDG